MRIVFFGSAHFAVPSLEALIKGSYEICAVVTQPDKKKGRHLHLGPTDVKSVAQKAGLKIFQPEDVNSADSVKYLNSLSADLFVVIAYGQILSQQVLDIPKNFSINLHASLLPKYRGAAPINWAIINGEKQTGISVIKLIRKMDAGPLLTRKEVSITGTDDSIILEEKLRKLGAELLIEALKSIKDKTYKLLEQDEKKVVLAPKLKKNDGCIDWNSPADEIYDKIRGCLPWPSAFTCYKGKLLKVYKASAEQDLALPNNLKPGEAFIDKNRVVVKTGKGVLAIEELQLESAKRMSAKDFIHGHKIKTGDILGRAKSP